MNEIINEKRKETMGMHLKWSQGKRVWIGTHEGKIVASVVIRPDGKYIAGIETRDEETTCYSMEEAVDWCERNI